MDASQKQAVDELEDVHAVYFTVTMLTETHRSRLEIPRSFTKKTGFPMSPNCTLVTSVSAQKEWPIHFAITEEEGGQRRATSIGHGWSVFLVDQDVKFGTLLVFENADDTCLAVTTYHPSSPRRIVPAGEVGLPRRPSDGSSFKKTLRQSHLKSGANGRLDFPTPFWRELGLEHFRDSWFTLFGPFAAVRVKSFVYEGPRQTFCYLSKGWSEFVALNDFKFGDKLCFAAVGNLEFNVDRV
ncbi:hypothetical protein M758_8G072200 [Ceratodon purpureus]|nr:hypothetical protein M758_8G072200 [Ceratodon purpureus]